MAFPNFPGIPPLKNPGPAGIATLASSQITKLLNSLAPKWGIYKKKGLGYSPAITVDSVISVDYANAANILNYPIEDGAFASYNKVQNPRDLSVVVTKGGSQDEISKFINDLETLQSSLELYSIITQGKAYVDVNIDRVEYRREATNGAHMIKAVIHFVEIRAAKAKFSKPGAASPTATAPSAQASVNNGQVQPASAPANVGTPQ
jgi:hypothetical protein